MTRHGASSKWSCLCCVAGDGIAPRRFIGEEATNPVISPFYKRRTQRDSAIGSPQVKRRKRLVHRSTYSAIRSFFFKSK